MFLFFIAAKVHRNIDFQAEEWGFFLNIAGAYPWQKPEEFRVPNILQSEYRPAS